MIHYKNNSYKFGMLGEIYVHKHIKCPRCSLKLIRNKPGTPGTDFVCKNNHWFQLKSRNYCAYSYGKLLKLLGGSFKHQVRAINEKNADILILFYCGNRVYNVFWLKNERIDRDLIIPRSIIKNGREYINSLIVCDTVDLIDLQLHIFKLWKNIKKRKKKGKKRVIQGLNLCSCVERCIHFEENARKFIKNDNTRKIVSENNQFFFVDISEMNCSCSFNGLCNHLRYFISKNQFANISEVIL